MSWRATSTTPIPAAWSSSPGSGSPIRSSNSSCWRCSTSFATRTGSPESGLWADHVIRLIGLELLRGHSNVAHRRPVSGDVTHAVLEAARDYIEANLTNDLSLSQIAIAVGARPHRLAKDFQSLTGLTLHQYVIQRRVDRAARLLRSTDHPIAAVALECGFADQSHLTTAFRRRVGITPAAYRSA